MDITKLADAGSNAGVRSSQHDVSKSFKAAGPILQLKFDNQLLRFAGFAYALIVFSRSKKRAHRMSFEISVIIPVFNLASHLLQAIGSVLDQSRRPMEIIIVDDCSTDDSLAVARSVSDPRIKILSTTVNSGSAAARNVGIQAATGDFIALLDGDDIWLPDHLQIVAGLLESHPSTVLAFSSTEAFGAQNWIWPIRVATDQPVNCFWECLSRVIIPQGNIVARRQALLDIGLYNQALRQAQDFDLFLRLSHRHEFVCTDQVTSRYRRHAGSITMRQPTNALHGVYQSRAWFGQKLAESASIDELTEYQQACLDYWEADLNHCLKRSNWHMMDFYLRQAPLVPGSEASLLRWRLRRAGGTVQKIWNFANRPVTNLFRSAA
jgi:glycosyltransferase involved in cell wall biosynthesis